MGHLVKSKLVPVVEKVDDSIHWKNLHPLANAIGNGFFNTYPLDSDLSGPAG